MSYEVVFKMFQLCNYGRKISEFGFCYKINERHIPDIEVNDLIIDYGTFIKDTMYFMGGRYYYMRCNTNTNIFEMYNVYTGRYEPFDIMKYITN